MKLHHQKVEATVLSWLCLMTNRDLRLHHLHFHLHLLLHRRHNSTNTIINIRQRPAQKLQLLWAVAASSDPDRQSLLLREAVRR